MKVPLPEPLVERLRAAQRVLVTSHRNPDGDAVGSSLALAQALTESGREAQVWFRDPLPTSFTALPGAARARVGDDIPPRDWDLAVVLECPTLDRSGLEKHLADLPILNIDHHLGNSEYGVERWIDAAAPSVGCLVFELVDHLGEGASPTVCDLLLLTLHTDTGGFRYANATERAFATAAELLRCGADPEKVANWVYESRTESSLRLLSSALETLQVDGRVATVLVTSEMLSGTLPGDTEGIVDHARSIAGVEAAAMLRPTESGAIKVSLRSKGQVDIEPIARHRGGGGHAKAAGFTLLEQDLEQARQKVVTWLRAAVKETHS